MPWRQVVIVYRIQGTPHALATLLCGVFSKSAIVNLTKIMKCYRAETAGATASKLGGCHPQVTCNLLIEGGGNNIICCI